MIEYKEVEQGIFVSKLGDITLASYISQQNHRIKEKIVKKFYFWGDYYVFRYKLNIYYVHRLVAKGYCEDWFEGCVVHHIDKNTKNNNYINLKCFSASDHIKYHRMLEKGSELAINRHKNFPITYGGEHHNSKSVNQYTVNNIFVKSFNSISEAYRETKISSADICSCCRGKLKTAGGFYWKYKEKQEITC